MTEKEIPDWFDEICLKATDRRMNLTDAKSLWREISKPENVAKLECVKPVIKGLQKYLDNTLFVDEEGESYDSDFEHCIDFAKKALKPFKKEGE